MVMSPTDSAPCFLFPADDTTTSHAISTRYGDDVHDVEKPSASTGFRYEYTPAPYLDQNVL
jgi:hypothetical protein